MKIGDRVYYFANGEIRGVDVIKVGRKYYHIEGRFLHREHCKISLEDNRSMSDYSRMQFYLSKEELEYKIKSANLDRNIFDMLLFFHRHKSRFKGLKLEEKEHLIVILQEIMPYIIKTKSN